MKKVTRENKGFSLVELVVVVLILGILTVAVTPQVMKWVGKSKISADKANANELKYAAQTALSDWQERGGEISASADFELEIDKDGAIIASTLKDWTDGTATESLKDVIDETLAGEYPKVQYDVLTGSVGFRITVEQGTGRITVSCKAQTVTT